MPEQQITLPTWDALATLADDALPLWETALLIARDEYPALDPDQCDAVLQQHVEHLRIEVTAQPEWPLKVAAINRYLFDELGYGGNDDDYYDPRNSYLNQVLERRLGNPISLAVVQMEVSRRLQLPLEGISFPGHFLVRLAVEDGVLVMDPFNGGRPLSVAELRERARVHMGGEPPDDEVLAQILEPAPPRAILMRMLRNLYGAHAEREQWDRAARSADRVLKLAPEQTDMLRGRGMAYLELGHLAGAREDLARYLQVEPDASDAATVRARLVELGTHRPRPH